MIGLGLGLSLGHFPPSGVGGAGYPLPVSGLYPGQMWQSDSAPHIGTLPTPVVKDQRWVKDPEDVEHLGRWVIHLDGPDTFTVTASMLFNLVGSKSWAVGVLINDLNPDVSTTNSILSLRNALGEAMIRIQLDNSNRYTLALFNNNTTLRYIRSTVTQKPGTFIFLRIWGDGSSINLDVLGETITITDFTDWTHSQGCDRFNMTDSTSTRPLQICNVSLCVDGSVCDSFACDEESGTEIANQTNPSNPAQLTDLNAHVLAWVPQSKKTQGLWIWDDVYSLWYLFAVYGSGYPLPTALFTGELWESYKYPVVTDLPATVDYSTRYVKSNVEYKGLKVVTLNGPDTLDIPVLENMLTDNWKIINTLKDLGATSAAFATFHAFIKGSSARMYFRLTSAGKFEVSFRNNDGTTQIAAIDVDCVLDQKLFRYEVEKIGNTITATVYVEGSVFSNSLADVSIIGWDGDGITRSYITDGASQIRPLQTGDIRQYLNDVLLDYIPCADGSGTVVKNYGQADRPDAILSDPNAWDGIWFPQDEITLMKWLWTGVLWVRFYRYLSALANLDFTNPALPGWERQYTDEDNFSIVDITGQSFTKAGMFTLSGGELWTNPDTGGSSARTEIQLKNSGNHGRTYDYTMWFMIDSTFVENASWTIITQWHDEPDPAIDEGWTNYPPHSPPLSFQYSAGNFKVAVVDNFDTNHVTTIISTPLAKGVWHKLRARVKWSLAADGTIESWLDDVPLEAGGQTVYQARNCFNQAGNYWKVGIYRDPLSPDVARVLIADVKSTIVG